ncbi:hypothetical protein [Mesorhizobium sp. LSJC264A00]|nr:hypothetical protein [Mesorhizobium sp. LSJC264A00]ESX14987.1 hypothetical protein X767_29065 [Mesorhizobium sp. LSJC264A00]
MRVFTAVAPVILPSLVVNRRVAIERDFHAFEFASMSPFDPLKLLNL